MSERELVEELRQRAERAQAVLNAPKPRDSLEDRLATIKKFREWCTPVLILHLIENYQPPDTPEEREGS